jgi:dihydroorotase (multifunctional complex type)
MFDTVLRGALVVSPSTNGRVDLGIVDGRFAAVLAPGTRVAAGRQVDLSGLTVIPGLVDAHVHFRGSPDDAGQPFRVGSAAALAGGVTTVLEMPVTDPMVLTADRLRERRERLAAEALGDFALYGGAGPGNLDELAGLRSAGAVGFKTFLHAATPGRERTLGTITATSNDEVIRVLTASAGTGLVHAIHAEDDRLLQFNQGRQDPTDPAAFHVATRPQLLEDVSVAAVATIGAELGARLHFVHVASPLSVDLLNFFLDRGADFSVETAPHYLRFTSAELGEYGMLAKCNPPLRSTYTQAALIERLERRAIHIVASDHCSYPPEQVATHLNDAVCAPAGFPGIQYMLPGLLTLVSEGRLSLSTVVESCSSAPARRFSLDRKGDIAAGWDADFVVIDLSASQAFSDLPHQDSGIANVPFFGTRSLVGSVVQTWLRGTQVFDGADITVEPGYGRWIAPNN